VPLAVDPVLEFDKTPHNLPRIKGSSRLRVRYGSKVLNWVTRLLFYAIFVLTILSAQTSHRLPERVTRTPSLRPSTALKSPADDVAVIYQELSSPLNRRASARGEFETTAQYKARLASWMTKYSNRQYVLLIETEDEYSLQYNADTEEMTLTIGEEYLVSDTVKIRSTRKLLGTYLGSNSFGVKRVVTKVSRDEYYARLFISSPFELFPAGEFGLKKPTVFRWPMTIAEAKLSKSALRLALVGTIPSPGVEEESSVVSPTTDTPLQVFRRDRTIPFRLQELRVVNVQSGLTVVAFSQTAQTNPQNISETKADQLNTITVDGDTQAASLVRRVNPPFPPLARQAHIQGSVEFNAVIGKDGHVENLQFVSGHPLLVTAATQAVEQWLYKPTISNGVPVAIITTIRVEFTLDQPK